MNTTKEQDMVILLKARLLDALDAHQQDRQNFYQTLEAIALAVDPKNTDVKLNELIEKIQLKFAATEEQPVKGD